MKQVWKYPVNKGKIVMPVNSKIVHFNMQGDIAMVWVEVETEVETADSGILRDLRIYGTGHPIPKNSKYIGTCFEGPFVWHLYEIGQDT